jgi:hypothetical protein
VFVSSQAALLATVLLDGAALRDPELARKIGRLQGRQRPTAQEARPLVVVQIGSSRTMAGLRGQVAETWLAQRLGRPVVLFNMGFPASGPILNRLNLERLFNAGVRPDLVLVEILPALLAADHPVMEVRPERLPASQLRYGEMRLVARHAGTLRPGLAREWWSGQMPPVFAFRFSFLSSVAPTLLPFTARTDHYSGIDDSGWAPVPRRSLEQERQALARSLSEYRDTLRTFRLSPRALGVLCETIRRAREEAVPAALVLMPEGPIFRSWYPSVVHQQIDKALAKLSQECDAPLIDLRGCVGEEGFLDSHHLYHEGAALFTHCLARQVEPQLRRVKDYTRSGRQVVEERVR